jgi:hypothetical protein
VQRFLHNELAPLGRDERTDPAKLAIIAQIRWLGDNFTPLQHRLSVVRIRALRPVPESMTIPRSKAECAPPETQRVSPSVTTSVADEALLANSVRTLALDALQAANSGAP